MTKRRLNVNACSLRNRYLNLRLVKVSERYLSLLQNQLWTLRISGANLTLPFHYIRYVKNDHNSLHVLKSQFMRMLWSKANWSNTFALRHCGILTRRYYECNFVTVEQEENGAESKEILYYRYQKNERTIAKNTLTMSDKIYNSIYI